MSVVARGNTFEVYVKRAGKRYRVAARSQEQGAAIEREITRCLDAGKAVDLETIKRIAAPTGGKTLRYCIDTIYPLRWEGAKSADTSKERLELIARELGDDYAIDAINRETIDTLMLAFKRKNNSVATINRKMSVLRVLLQECHDRGWRGELPKMPHKKEGKGRVRYLTDDEEALIISRTRYLGRGELADLWAFLLDTGARIGEALKVEWVDVHDTQVTFVDTKNGETRTVPLTKRAQTILKSRRAEPRPFALEYYQAKDFWDRLRMLLDKENDELFVIHILRHTCASRLVQRGVALLVVKEFLGHKAIQTTMRYAHLAPSNLTDAVALLEPQEAPCTKQSSLHLSVVRS